MQIQITSEMPEKLNFLVYNARAFPTYPFSHFYPNVLCLSWIIMYLHLYPKGTSKLMYLSDYSISSLVSILKIQTALFCITIALFIG
jgi:ABC-type transport system involved in cytochrome c biogenesis permease subunit